MSDILSLGDQLAPVLNTLIIPISGCVIAVVAIVATCYRKIQIAEMETMLKMEMIQRGMSAEDIECVLRAKLSSSKAKSSAKAMSPAA